MSRPGSPLHRPRRPVLLTSTAMVGLLTIWVAWELAGRPGDTKIIGDLFFYPVGIVASLTAGQAGRRCAAQSRLRSAWYLLGVAAAVYLAGDITQTIYEANEPLPFPSLSDAFYLAFYVFALVGLLRFTAQTSSRGERIRLGLDLGIVAIGGSAIVIDLVLGPTIVASTPDVLSSVVSIAYPVGDLVLMVALGTVLLRRPTPSTEVPLRLLAVGLAFFIAADLIYGYTQLTSSYSGGDWVDGLWIAAIAIWAVAASAQETPVARLDPRSLEARGRPSWAPYVTLTGISLLLAHAERDDALFPNLTLVIAAVACAALIAMRQYLAQRDLIHTQDRLAHQTLHDALTGLANRVLVIDRAEQALARAARTGDPLSVLYIDLDGFKQVNDNLGHGAGDELLRIVADRLTGMVRAGDTVGRLAGDEFIVLLDGYGLDAGPGMVAQRICELLATPAELTSAGSRILSVSASVGVAQSCTGTVDELLRNADFALYEAKRAGRNRWSVFDAEMRAAARERLELEMDLHDALAAGQFGLLYQPIVDLDTRTIRGAEALLRWVHPTRGMIGPNLFIPLAEQKGEIATIGRWVLRTACAQAAEWARLGHPLRVAVNVSARQLDNPGFTTEVAAVLADTGLCATDLTLEITETALMRDPEEAAHMLNQLKGLGVRVAIDDFGTGYSSLGYLLRFPVDELKIDRSFVSEINTSGGSDALVDSLIQLGDRLGIETLAEGIEEERQRDFLRRRQCRLGQGYLFARPLEPDALLELVTAGAASVAPAPAPRA